MVSETDASFFGARKFLRHLLQLSDWCWVSIEFKVIENKTVHEPYPLS